jgi:uncharacterized membrane protein YdjX (TVP38/TMEM64 family)
LDSVSAKPWKSPWFWIALAAIALVVAFMTFSSTFKEWIEAVVRWGEGILRAHPVGGSVVFFFLSAVSAMLAFASSTLLVPSATEVLGKPVTFALLWAGWMAGAVAAYAIGHFSRPLLRRLVDANRLKEYQEFASKRMSFGWALLLCFALPSELPGYLLGGLHYSFWRFVGAMAISEAAYALGVIVVGESLTEAKPGTLAVAVGVLVIIAVGAGWLLRRRAKRKTRRKQS